MVLKSDMYNWYKMDKIWSKISWFSVKNPIFHMVSISTRLLHLEAKEY